MSTLGIVLIAVGVIVVLLFIGGLIAAGRRERQGEPSFGRHLAEADRALEVARAGDRGWDPTLMERVARDALATSHPGVRFDAVRLVLVDDQPGVERDRARYEADDGEQRVHVVLNRDEAGWHGETES